MLNKEKNLQKICDAQKLYIYGAGKYGRKMLKLLTKMNFLSKLQGFIVSSKPGNPDQIEGFTVFSVDQIHDKASLILIGVGDSYQEDIIQKLKANAFKNFIIAADLAYMLDEEPETTPSVITVGTKELVTCQYNGEEFVRWDFAVRLLAIDNYLKKNDYGMALYKKMQENRVRAGYGEAAENRFNELIKSFLQNGYDATSEIIVNERLKLINGAHRLALALYLNIPKITVRIDRTADDVYYGKDWFCKHFTQEECERINERTLIMCNECKEKTRAVIWPPAMPYCDNIIDDIQKKYPIDNIERISLPQSIFVQLVKGVYHIDDIADWKVNTKLEHIILPNATDYEVCFFDIDFGNPLFRIKQAGGVLSTKGEQLKKEIREKYKDKVENYFPDTIFHTGDNFLQSRYIRELIHQDFSLAPFFEAIKDYHWMLIKTETDSIPKDFPNSYPMFKDIDMLCTSQDLSKIEKQIALFFDKIKGTACEWRKVEKTPNKTLFRLELNGFLIIQFDICTNINYINDDFFNKSLENRISKNGYFIPQQKDEFIYRLCEIKDHPQKTHHIDYCKKIIDNYHKEEILCAIKDDYKNDFLKIIGGLSDHA